MWDRWRPVGFPWHDRNPLAHGEEKEDGEEIKLTVSGQS